MLSNWLSIAQVMMLTDQAVEELLPLGSTDLLEIDRMQISNRALDGGSVNLNVYGFSSIGKRVGEFTLGRRQLDQALRLQQQQKAAADHVFECAICLSPLPCPANLLRNKAPASLGMVRYDFSDKVNIRLGNITCAVCRNDFHAWQYRESNTGTQEKSNNLLKKIRLTQLQGKTLPLFIEMIPITRNFLAGYE